MQVAILGHPFANVGMGEQVRAGIRSLRAVHIDHQIVDVYEHDGRTDAEHLALVGQKEVGRCTADYRIFHVNGDEVAPVLAHIESRKIAFGAGYNIIMPAWELARYPKVWIDVLNRFDEIWAISEFVKSSLAAAGMQSIHIGQSAEIPLRAFLPRRYFGIRESAFVFLHFFDLSSYAARKNPMAVIELYEAIKARRPHDDVQLVLKVKKGAERGEDWLLPLRERLPNAVFVSELLDTFETHSLIAACNCFVSLHRGEGFGRGPAEAMFIGKLALATGWSGNLDFMTPDTSLLVNYRLVDVAPGEYPHCDGQQWAEPDVQHATALVLRVLDDPAYARSLAIAGMRQARAVCSNRSVGLRVLSRLQALATPQVESSAMQTRKVLG